MALAGVACDTDDGDGADTDTPMSEDVELPAACVGFEDVLRLDAPRYGEDAEDVCDDDGAPLGTFGTQGTLNRPWVCLGDFDESDTHRDLMGGDASGSAPSTYMGMYTYENEAGEPSYVAAMVTDHGFTWVTRCVASSPSSGDSIIDVEDRSFGDALCGGMPLTVGLPSDPGQVVFESEDGPCSLSLHPVSGFPQ